MTDVLSIEVRATRVAVVTLNRPDVLNALDLELREALADAFLGFAKDSGIRAVVVTGGNQVFAAGADIKAMANDTANQAAESPRSRLWKPIKDYPRPIIAAVNGYALGGGCELAMHCDIIVAGRGARFGQPEIRVGIMPGAGGTQRLLRAIGKFKTMKMVLTGEAITAESAERAGLVSEVVEDEAVLERAIAIAETIARLPAAAAMRIKEAVLFGADLPLDAALAFEQRSMQLLFGTPDQREGMSAFIEKRKPNFE